MNRKYVTEDFLKAVESRVAKFSIGGSTLRNQGSTGMQEIAKNYIIEKKVLKSLADKNEKEFKKGLDKHTNKLREKFIAEYKKNSNNQPLDTNKLWWGSARKALNVFLQEAFYNRFLYEKYKLESIGAFLEIPLDSYVYNHLKKHKDEVKDFPKKHVPIMRQDNNYNKKLQGCASKIAKEKKMPRICLDILFWGNDVPKTKKKTK